MEASTSSIAQAEQDHETLAWVDNVESGMPQGEDITAAELRADYLLEKVAEEEARAAHLKDFTARRIAMVQSHADTEGAKIERRIAWLQSRIRTLVPMDAERFQESYGKKSIKLPNGTVGFRAVRPTVDITDAEKVLAFAKSNGLEVTVKESVGKTPLIEFVKAGGELPDPMEAGFEWVDGYDAFYAKTGGGR